jgi:hypothetical protein
VAWLEIERELTLPFGQQGAQDDTQRRPSLELRRDVLDRQQVRERIEAITSRRAGADETPLLQVP